MCEVLAVSTVVHADEKFRSVRSVWAFLSEKVRVIIHGCHKDGATLAQLLDKDTFQGALVSDDFSPPCSWRSGGFIATGFQWLPRLQLGWDRSAGDLGTPGLCGGSGQRPPPRFAAFPCQRRPCCETAR